MTRTPMEKTALLWAAASAGLMIVGAIGPWVTALDGVASLGGLDGGSDGWIVLVVAGISLAVLAAVSYGSSPRIAWSIPVLALIGLWYAVINRRNVLDTREWTLGDIFADSDRPTGDTDFEVGWGLTLAMGASVSLLVASAVFLIAARRSTRDAS